MFGFVCAFRMQHHLGHQNAPKDWVEIEDTTGAPTAEIKNDVLFMVTNILWY